MKNDNINKIDIKTDFDIWVASVRNRIKAANDASTRARYSLLFLSMVSLGSIVSLFSYFFSWNRGLVKYFTDKSVNEFILQQTVREWISTQTYQLPILGIKVMASDVQIFGPIFLLLVSTWNYFEVRRDHFTTCRLLQDNYIVLNAALRETNSKAIIFAQEVYHSITGYTIFNTIQNDEPESNLANQTVDNADSKSSSMINIRQSIIKFLAITPICAILFIVFTRLATFCFLSSTITGKVHSFSSITTFRLILLLLGGVSSVFALYLTYTNAKKVYKLTTASRNLLEMYKKWAFESEPQNADNIDLQTQ